MQVDRAAIAPDVAKANLRLKFNTSGRQAKKAQGKGGKGVRVQQKSAYHWQLDQSMSDSRSSVAGSRWAGQVRVLLEASCVTTLSGGGVALYGHFSVYYLCCGSGISL